MNRTAISRIANAARTASVEGALQAGAGKAFDYSLEPKAAVGDRQKLEYKFTVGDDFRIGDLQVDLDIDHQNRSDLVVVLTAPSGLYMPLVEREGMPAPDLKQRFNLTRAFDRELSKGEWTLTIEDQADGDVGTLNSFSVHMAEGEARPLPAQPGLADDFTEHSGPVRLETTATGDGRYQLLDRTRGQGIETVDGVGQISSGSLKPITDDNNIWGEDTDGPRQRGALDVQYGAQMTYDFLHDVLGRDSLDGQGMKISAVVHMGDGFPVPVTTWQGNQLFVVDGPEGRPETNLDVIGSELARGMNAFTGKFVGTPEAYALDDAFSKILGGAGVEWYAMQQNGAVPRTLNPYVVGEHIAPGGWMASHDMANPTDFSGKPMDHAMLFNEERPWECAGIVTNAFYLLTHGGTNHTSGIEVKDPIDLGRGVQIFGRAMLDELPAGASFAEARQATIAAATKLFGADSAEVAKLNEAWAAVGVPASLDGAPRPR